MARAKRSIAASGSASQLFTHPLKRQASAKLGLSAWIIRRRRRSLPHIRLQSGIHYPLSPRSVYTGCAGRLLPFLTLALTLTLRGVEREDGDLGADAEAEPPAEADALIDVDRSPPVMAQSSGQPACLLADKEPANAWPVDLAAVRVAAEHQIHAPLAFQKLILLGRVRVVREQQAGHGGGKTVEGPLSRAEQ